MYKAYPQLVTLGMKEADDIAAHLAEAKGLGYNALW